MTDQTMETVTQQQETVTKQKNPLRIEQGRKLVEYNHHKKEDLKRLNEQITKQDVMEHKPKPGTNTYVYVGGLSLLGLASVGTSCIVNSRNQNKLQLMFQHFHLTSAM